MNDELLMMIGDLRIMVKYGPDTVDMHTMVHVTTMRCWLPVRTEMLCDLVYRYADVERVEDWLPVGTPKGWVLGELDRLAEFVTGDDT
jgi:hypothetical protein